MPNFFLWLITFLHGLAIFGGLFFVLLLATPWIRIERVEHRCERCQNYLQCHEDCIGYPGVSYPCRDYKKKKDKP